MIGSLLRADGWLAVAGYALVLGGAIVDSYAAGVAGLLILAAACTCTVVGELARVMR